MASALYALPPILGYFVSAALAVTPQTHALRVALCPITMALALLAVSSLDMSVDCRDQRHNNSLFVFLMIYLATRTMDWTISKGPLVRRPHPVKGALSTVMDILDLALSLRGLGWDWSCGLHIPRETRPTNRRGFILCVIFSAVFHVLLCGILYIVLRSFSPLGIGAHGGSIFDETLPFHMQYLRGSIISACGFFNIYAFIQMQYDVCTLIGVLVFGQEPEQWPPAFDAPWLATSMSELWGRRWHQFFRRMFLVQGSFPLSFFGQFGYVLGAFLSSAVQHHIVMLVLDDRLEAWRLLVGFGMMGAVVLAEISFKRLTGRKVGGMVGWVWTMVWLLLWGNLIIDGFARVGSFESARFTESLVPRRAVVERLVVDFDSLLRAM